MSTADRKAELERKKAKLQQMREEKKRKEEEKKRKEVEDAQAAEDNAGGPDLRSETEKMLKDLGIPDAAVGRAKATSHHSQLSQEGGDSLSMPHIPVSSSPKVKTKLTMSKTSQTSIPPKEIVSYCKETQTPQPQIDKEDNKLSSASSTRSSGDGSPHSYGSPYSSSPRFTFPKLEWDDEFFQDDDNDSLDVSMNTPPAVHMSHKMPHVEPVKPADAPSKDEQAAQKEEKKEVMPLTEDEKRKIIGTEDFNRFVDKSSRIIERALTETCDIFTDYTGGDRDDQESGLQEGEKLKLNRQFYDERWSKHRTITCMDWSAQHPELLVASYNNNEDAPHEPDGVALIWNLKFKKNTPEYIFHCQSAVMSTCFAKFHPNLVIGGTYSGQIVLWDNRSHKRTPAQRTPLSAAAHTHPVYCVSVVGTQNAHNLISVSTDGKMCSWSLDMLSAPQDSMELQHKQSKAVAATSMSFLSGDVNNFIVGSEEGAVYTACRHGSKAGISDMFESHQGPVTGIDCHNVQGQIDFSHYFLSSSFDWTIKLWNIKESKPLHSFEDNSDYVYDVKWSPIHPSLFASVDGMGRLDLWNLNHDIEVPIATTYLENNVALNRCRWHQNGHQIAVGDDLGKVHIYDVGENVAVPRNDEWNNFVHSLQDIRANQADQEDDGSLSLMTSPLR